MADALACGRRFRVLAVVDDFRRECLGLVVDVSLSVTRELDRIAEGRGYPALIVSDNGTELTSHALLRWQEERGVPWHYVAPGKPQQNGFVESFNGHALCYARRALWPLLARNYPQELEPSRAL